MSDVFGVWPVSIEPEIQMVNWRLYRVKFEYYRVEFEYDDVVEPSVHAVGMASDSGGIYETNDTATYPRVCSPIQEFAKDGGEIVCLTRSGRRYRLTGAPGWGDPQQKIWGQWSKINGVTEAVDVTSEFWKEEDND